MELLGASEGVGALIADARAMLETSTVMAYVVLVIVFVSLFEYLITRALIFQKDWGRTPSLQSSDVWEQRLAAGVAFLARMRMKQGAPDES